MIWVVTSGRRALDVADVVDAVLHHYWQLVGHGQRYLGGRSEACVKYQRGILTSMWRQHGIT